MLKVTNLEKSFGELQVIKSVNLEINNKEVVSIVGPSGAGKSTLLHILGTLDKPDKGLIEYEGKDITLLKQKDLDLFRNKNIGFVFQFHNLLPEFTAIENVSIPGLLYNKDENEVSQKAEHLLETLGLIDRFKHKPSELSGGEQQRVAVARALINDPKIIFADEPSGNLDSKNADELHQLIFDLRDSTNQSFVIVTHNKSLAQGSDRMLTITDGCI